jgi:peptidoglycan/LPS O-acetylase OafA/YrhL
LWYLHTQDCDILTESLIHLSQQGDASRTALAVLVTAHGSDLHEHPDSALQYEMVPASMTDMPQRAGLVARVPSLDGARAVSALLVIVAHLRIVGWVPFLGPLDEQDPFTYGKYFDFGNLGVRVFFVISGFLITSLLLAEQESTARISLPRFYLRRAVRIFPAYWAYIAGIAVLIYIGRNDALWTDIFQALAYLTDYATPAGALTATWSLSVEEQFYLVWPVLMILLGVTKAYRACLVVLLAAPVFRVFSDAGMWPTSSKFSFEASSDALAVGCLLALLRGHLWALRPYRQLVGSGFSWLIPLVALVLMSGLFPFSVRDLAGIPILNIGVAILLDRYMRFPATTVGGLLNLAPVAWLGKISYSLYLWQQLIAFSRWPILVKIPLMIAFAVASFYLIERPLLSLRSRLRTRRVTSDPGGALQANPQQPAG